MPPVHPKDRLQRILQGSIRIHFIHVQAGAFRIGRFDVPCLIRCRMDNHRNGPELVVTLDLREALEAVLDRYVKIQKNEVGEGGGPFQVVDQVLASFEPLQLGVDVELLKGGVKEDDFVAVIIA